MDYETRTIHIVHDGCYIVKPIGTTGIRATIILNHNILYFHTCWQACTTDFLRLVKITAQQTGYTVAPHFAKFLTDIERVEYTELIMNGERI